MIVLHFLKLLWHNSLHAAKELEEPCGSHLGKVTISQAGGMVKIELVQISFLFDWGKK